MKPDITVLVASFAGALLCGCVASPTGPAVSARAATSNSPQSQLDIPQPPDSATKLNSIRIGMSREEVQSIMGAPDSKSAQANAEYLTYYLLDTGSDYERHRPYMIRLVAGRVESFGRFSELLDLQNRPVGASGGTATADLATQLEGIKELRDKGVLTDEEFQKAKTRLLSEP
jgi:hypothetical protein